MTSPMYWTKDHDLLLIRQVLAVDPYSQPKGSRGRARLWEEIARSLNSVSAPQFSVTVRSVRDRVNLVLIKKHKKKVAEENKASGIAPDEPSEFELGMDEICEKAEAAERDQQVISEERKARLEKEKKQAKDMQAKALEKVGETKKRVAVSGGKEPEKKEKRARRSGTETIAYLKEKSAKEIQIRQEELQIRKEEQLARAKRQEQMTQQLIQQQVHQQDMFAILQQQQNQQLQQLNMMQMVMMLQQQQQSQALLAVLLWKFAKK